MRNRIAQALSSIKASALASVSDMATFGGGLLSLVKSILTSKTVQQTARQTTLQTVEGMSLSAMAALPKAMLRYPEAQDPIWSALWKGAVSYAIPAVLYRAGLRPVLMSAVEGTYAQYPFYFADAVANLYFVRAGANLTLDMIFYGLAIAKTATPQPEELKHDHDSLVPCPEICGALVNQQASFMAKINGIAALKAIRLTDYTVSTFFLTFEQPIVPIVGTFVTFPFKRLIEGRLLVGNKLAAVGMCADHREDILSANNGYCFGKGLSYYLTLQLLNCLTICSMRYLISLTGTTVPYYSDYFVEDALEYLVWLSFTVAETQVNNALPGKERGVEIFYRPTQAVSAAITFLIDKITGAFKPLVTENASAKKAKTKQDEVDFTWTAPIVNFFQSMPVQMLLTLVNSDLLSLDKFLKRRSVEKFANAYSKTLHENIDWFKGLRKGRVPRFVLEKLVPEALVSSSSKQIVLTLRKKRWDAPVGYIEKFIHRMCPTDFSHLPHVASSSALEDAVAAAAQPKKIDPEAVTELQFAQQAASALPAVPEQSPVAPKEPIIAAPQSRLLGGQVTKRPLQKKREETEEEGARMSEAARLMLQKKDD